MALLLKYGADTDAKDQVRGAGFGGVGGIGTTLQDGRRAVDVAKAKSPTRKEGPTDGSVWDLLQKGGARK